jgi:DNA-binding NarL/FixJ family response regulator
MESTTVMEESVHSTVPIEILLVDEQLIFREGLKRLLQTESEFMVVGDASDPDAALKAIERLQPDVLVVSLSGRLLARMMQTLQDLVAAGNHVRTILLTTTIEKAHIVQAQQLGVAGILLKETSPAVLYESVRSVAAGRCWLGQQPLDDLVEGLRHLSPSNKNRFGLTPRELEIVEAVRRGDTNKVIARDLAITQDTVKHHLTNIFTKIGVFTRLQLAVFAMNHKLGVGEKEEKSSSAWPAA